MTTANQIVAFLNEQGPGWVNPAATVDRVTHGDGSRPVTKAAVTWMATTRIVQQAVQAGCDLLVVHEPIIWNHYDRDEDSFDPARSQAKRHLLDQHNLTVLRCHDLWDQYPNIGIGPVWALALGFDQFTIERYTDGFIFLLCTLSPPSTLGSIARQIAQKAQSIHQQAVYVTGPMDLPINKFALNIGAAGSHGKYMVDARDRFGIQAAVASEFCWWRDASWALDNDFGLIHVNHGVSECLGIQTLCNFLREKFPDVRFDYLLESAPYTVMTADGPVK